MFKLNLETKTKEQEIIKQYLEENVSEVLAEKINNGVKIVKDSKTLINKKDLNGFMKYANDEARKLAEKGSTCDCIEDKVVYGWAIHYFEEDEIVGTLFNEDGTEYKEQIQVKPTSYTPPKIEPKKPSNEQASFFNLFSENKQEEVQSIEEKQYHQSTKTTDILTLKEKQTLVDIFDEPEIEKGLLNEIDKELVKVNNQVVNTTTGEVVEPKTITTISINKDYMKILYTLLDSKLEVK